LGPKSLSAKNLQVLQHIANGLCCKEISTAMNLKETAIRHHRVECIRKLKAGNIGQAIFLATQAGLLK
jgi:DNA-binding NarL/FixJ family response regulator